MGATARLEWRGIEPVGPDERSTRPAQLFAIWYAAGLGLVPIGVGTIAAAQFVGLGWWDGLLAIVIGHIVAAVLVGLLAARGAPTGSPQLALSRRTFGRAVALPALAAWIGLVGTAAVTIVFGAEAIVRLTDGTAPRWLGVLLVGGAAAILALLGYPSLRRILVLIAIVQTVAFAAITLALAGSLDLGLSDGPTASPGTFLLMIAVAAAVDLTWAVAASDHARHVTPSTSGWTVFGVTVAGLALPGIWLGALGLAVAPALVPAADPVSELVGLLGGGASGAVGALAIGLWSFAVGGMLLYSASLSALAPGLPVRRPIVAGVTGLLGLGLAAILVASDTQGWLENMVLILAYWIPAWAAILLVDRAGARPTTSVAARARALPHGLSALIGLLAGGLVAIVFMDQSLFIGPGASALGGADLGYLASFVVGGVVFGALERLWPAARHPHPTPEPAAVPAPMPSQDG